ncbi:MAG TPA: aldehyde dehydrogenase family protein, partial [Nitrospiria bacterium]|nr:aldehyde dehydrogenase family protein [Nitrospiria bacterium]
MPKQNFNIFNLISPVDGQRLRTLRLLSGRGISTLFSHNAEPSKPGTKAETLRFLKRLCLKIKENRADLVPMLVMETGYIRSDSEEIIDGSIEFLEEFGKEVETARSTGKAVALPFGTDAERKIHLASRPYRQVAVIIPQNASFGITLIVLAAALYSGVKLVLRASLQSGLTTEILKKLVKESNPPESSVEFVSCLAVDFLRACYKSPSVDLIHYIGSNRYVHSILIDAFNAGKASLLDGQGNGLVYVDRSFPVDKAIKIITAGAVRYNGETCTSINGVLCHPDIYKRLRNGLSESLGALSVGHPMEAGTDVGPLFSKTQADHIGNLVRSSGGEFLSGGEIKGAYITPGLIEGEDRGRALVTE